MVMTRDEFDKRVAELFDNCTPGDLAIEIAHNENRIAELERELADLKEGRTAIIPQSREHAEKLLFLAEAFWNGNENVVGWKNRAT